MCPVCWGSNQFCVVILPPSQRACLSRWSAPIKWAINNVWTSLGCSKQNRARESNSLKIPEWIITSTHACDLSVDGSQGGNYILKTHKSRTRTTIIAQLSITLCNSNGTQTSQSSNKPTLMTLLLPVVSLLSAVRWLLSAVRCPPAVRLPGVSVNPRHV